MIATSLTPYIGYDKSAKIVKGRYSSKSFSNTYHWSLDYNVLSGLNDHDLKINSNIIIFLRAYI